MYHHSISVEQTLYRGLLPWTTDKDRGNPAEPLGIPRR